MSRVAALALVMLLSVGCGEEPAPVEPQPTEETAPTSPDEPTADEEAPLEPESEPAPEPSAGAAAAQHAEALRILDQDAPRAAQMLEAACDESFGASCVALADLLERGAPGVDTDPERAHGLLEQACFSGSTVACDRLGH